MLESNRYIHKKLTTFVRVISLLLPIMCVVLLLSQTVFAKTTYVINDGDRVHVHTTFATDPMDVLTEAGFELGTDDTYTTQQSLTGSEITIRRLQVVGIVYGGQYFTVNTYGETVESLLEGLDMLPGEYDSVSEALDSQTYDGMCIVIDRSIEIEETYTVTVPFDTYYTLDATLAADEQKVLIAGSDGQLQLQDLVRYLNARELSRENLTTNVVTESVGQVVAVGSLEGIDEQFIVESVEMPENDAPEAVVIGGELYIGDGLIITSDGQVLTYNDTMQVKATAYTHTDPGCNMTTATGTTVRIGTVAVDPRMIPYGTRMFIVTDDGCYIYGIGVAEDCGGAIKGNRIDLYFPTDEQCVRFGVRYATIYFLG